MSVGSTDLRERVLLLFVFLKARSVALDVFLVGLEARFGGGDEVVREVRAGAVDGVDLGDGLDTELCTDFGVFE